MMFFDIKQSIVHKYFVFFENRHITLSALVFSLISYGITFVSLYLMLFLEAWLAGDLSGPASNLVFTPISELNADEIFADFYLSVLIVPLAETLIFHVLLIFLTVKILRNVALSIVINALMFSYAHIGNDIFSNFHTVLSGLFYAYGFLFWKQIKGSVNAGIQFSFTAHALHNFWSHCLAYVPLPWIH